MSSIISRKSGGKKAEEDYSDGSSHSAMNRGKFMQDLKRERHQGGRKRAGRASKELQIPFKLGERENSNTGF